MTRQSPTKRACPKCTCKLHMQSVPTPITIIRRDPTRFVCPLQNISVLLNVRITHAIKRVRSTTYDPKQTCTCHPIRREAPIAPVWFTEHRNTCHNTLKRESSRITLSIARPTRARQHSAISRTPQQQTTTHRYNHYKHLLCTIKLLTVHIETNYTYKDSRSQRRRHPHTYLKLYGGYG